MTPEHPEWVLLLTDLFGAVGGIPAFNQEFVSAFSAIARDKGWHVTVLVLNDPMTMERSSSGYDYKAFGGNRLRFVCESVRALRDATGVVFGHVHLTPLAVAVTKGGRWMMAHGIEVWGRLGWLRRLGLSRMDRILCVSRFTRDRLIERHQVKPERTALFPNTARLSLPDEKPLPGTPDLGGKKIIFTVSRLWPQERYKKIDRVIEAMPQVLAAVPEARYIIAGQGEDRKRLENLARVLGVHESIFFVGKLTDSQLRKAYEACDLFILPSLGEGFGIVFLEAMACGKPCIGADAGAIPEVIDNGRTGLLVKPDSSEDIARALIQLLRDKTKRCSMGAAGRERFLSEFAAPHFQERLARLVEKDARP